RRKNYIQERKEHINAAFRGYGAAVQIIAVSLFMVIFPLCGLWIDSRIGTGLLFAGIGLVLGFYTTISQLIQISKNETRFIEGKENDDDTNTNSDKPDGDE
ncbi:MAG: hypothetical protein LBU65_07400, partial [Planctomycetaceae bacterium]|nr:hypothetical protein [Planctomycetaceae bacterium]